MPGTVRRLSLLLLVAAAAVPAAGCGGSKSSGTTDPTEWADSLCSAITTWTSSLTSAGNSLKGGNLSKSSLTDAANDIKSSSDTFVSDLKGLGRPDTEAGEQAQSSLNKLADDIDKDVQGMKSDVDQASGTNGALTAASKVTETLSTMGTQITSTFSDLQKIDAKGELEDAFKNADSCKSLAKKSSS